VSDKIQLIKNMLDRVNEMIIGAWLQPAQVAGVHSIGASAVLLG
jgi:3-phosphoglycerate kinase